MLAFLLPRSLMTKIAATVEGVRARWEAIAHRQLDLAEAELADREAFAGITVPVAPDAPAALGDASGESGTPTNRIGHSQGKNGRKTTVARDAS